MTCKRAFFSLPLELRCLIYNYLVPTCGLLILSDFEAEHSMDKSSNESSRLLRQKPIESLAVSRYIQDECIAKGPGFPVQSYALDEDYLILQRKAACKSYLVDLDMNAAPVFKNPARQRQGKQDDLCTIIEFTRCISLDRARLGYECCRMNHKQPQASRSDTFTVYALPVVASAPDSKVSNVVRLNEGDSCNSFPQTSNSRKESAKQDGAFGALLRANRRAHDEFSSILYQQIVFIFNDVTTLQDFVKRVPSQLRQQIRRLAFIWNNDAMIRGPSARIDRVLKRNFSGLREAHLTYMSNDASFAWWPDRKLAHFPAIKQLLNYQRWADHKGIKLRTTLILSVGADADETATNVSKAFAESKELFLQLDEKLQWQMRVMTQEDIFVETREMIQRFTVPLPDGTRVGAIPIRGSMPFDLR